MKMFTLILFVVVLTVAGCEQSAILNPEQAAKNLRLAQEATAQAEEEHRLAMERLEKAEQANQEAEELLRQAQEKIEQHENIEDEISNTARESDPLFMSPDDYESIYGVIMHHVDIINGDMSKAEAMGFRAAWKLNRAMYSGILQRVAYYAMFGREDYLDQYRHREEITVEQVEERILEILARYNNNMTIDELNNNILISHEIYDKMGFLD